MTKKFKNQTAYFATLSAISLVALALGNNSFLFNPIGWLDPYYYTGYFLHWADPTFLAGYYKEARLPWILSGWLTYKLFAPVPAAIILHLSFFLAGAIATYCACSHFVSKQSAFLTAISLLFMDDWLGAGGADYSNTGANTFFYVSFYFLTVAAIKHKNRASLTYAAAFGVFYISAVSCNILLASFLPALVMHFLMVGRVRASELTSVLMPVVFAISGAAVTIALLCFANYAVGRPPLFFMALIKMLFGFAANSEGEQQWWRPMSTWIANAKWLAFPTTCALVGGTLGLLRLRKLGASDHPAQMLLGHSFALTSTICLWFVLQSRGHVILSWYYHATPLMIFGIPLLALIAEHRMTSKADNEMSMTLWVPIALFIVGAIHLKIGTHLNYFRLSPLLFSLIIYAAAFSGLILIRTKLPAVLAWASLFAVVNSQYSAHTGAAEARADFHQLAVEVDSGIRKIDPTISRIILAYDSAEGLDITERAKSINSLGYNTQKSGDIRAKGFDVTGQDIIIARISRHGMSDFPTVANKNIGPDTHRNFATMIFQSHREKIFVHFHKSPQISIYNTTIATLLEDGDLLKQWQINIYGHTGPIDQARKSAVTFDGNGPRFSARDPKDHIATPLIPLPAGNSALRISMHKPNHVEGECHAIVQNQRYEGIGSFECWSAIENGWDAHALKLNNDVTAVRITLKAKTSKGGVGVTTIPDQLKFEVGEFAKP